MARKALVEKQKRVCFRELANKGEIPGVKKSSW